MIYTSEQLTDLITKAESYFQRLSNIDLDDLSKGKKVKNLQKIECLWLYKEALSYAKDLELYDSEETTALYKSLMDIVAGKNTTLLISDGSISAPSLDYYTNGGGLTSVGLEAILPDIFLIANSPLTNDGTIQIGFASQVAAKVLASPVGASGVPSFRTLQITDIDLLNTALDDAAARANHTGTQLASTISDFASTARSSISLTTTGTSGAATYNSSTGVLNIPAYEGGSGISGGTTGKLVKFSSATTIADSILTESSGNVTVAGTFTVGAVGGQGVLYFPNTVSGFDSRLETEYGSNAFSIYGATNQIRFTQNSIQVGTESHNYVINKGTHTATILVNYTERLKIEGAGLTNKSQFLNTNVLINTTTDDGSNKLQVSGSIKSTEDSTFNGIKVGIGLGGFNTNTIIGYNTFTSNTTGQYNVALGDYALYKNTTGWENTALGTQALYNNTIGSNNVSVGENTLYYNVSGDANTALGAFALERITSGASNIAIGFRAGRSTGSASFNTKSDNSIFIGNDVGPLNINQTNQIVIGYNIFGNGSNTVTIGDGNITDNYFNGNLILSSTPATISAASSYNMLVRNSSTGAIEKVSSNDISFVKLKYANINGLTTGTYVIPNLQNNFVPLGYTVVVNTATAVSGAATVSIGTNASSYNNVDTLPALGLSSASTTGQVYSKFFDDVNKNKLNAADDLRINVSVAGTGTTYNIDIILFGYIIT